MISYEQPDPAAEKAARKRQLRWAVLWFMIFLGIVLVFYAKAYFEPAATDKGKYSEMLHLRGVVRLLGRTETGFLGPLTHRLGLLDHYRKRFRSLEDELLASGYLTNASFAVAGVSPSAPGQVVNRLGFATSGTDALIGTVIVYQGSVNLICRPSDIPRLWAALQGMSNSIPTDLRQ